MRLLFQAFPFSCPVFPRAALCSKPAVAAIAGCWLLGAVSAPAQNGSLAWARRAGSQSIDEGIGLAVDTAGNVFTTGYFKLTATFGPGEPNETILSSSNQDMFVAKHAPDGSLIWVRQAKGFLRGTAIGLDASGSIYVLGYHNSQTKFNEGTPDEIVLNGLGQDAFLAKFDATGKCLWAKTAGGNNNEFANGLAVDAAGNSFVTGRYGSNPAVFGAGEANETSLAGLGGNNGEDIFIAKYDTNGLLQWAKRAGGATGNNGAGIGVDAVGNCYVTGSFTGTSTFGPGEANETSLVGPSGGNDEIFVAKFGPDGALIWVRPGQGQGAHDRGNGIAVDAAGNCYTTGTYQTVAPFGGQLNPTQLTLGGQDDVFVAKHDTNGNLLWVKMAVGSGSQFALGIAIDPEGNSYITGYGSGLTFGAEEPGQVALGGVGAQDVFVAKFDPNGLTQWAKLAGGSSDDRGLAIAFGVGAVHVMGRFGLTATFGSGEANQTALTSRGNLDIFVAKFLAGNIVLQSPTFAGYTLLPNGNPRLTLSGTGGGTYTIRRSSGIAPATWTDLGEVTLDGAGQGFFEDTDEALTFPAFYQGTGE